MIGVGLIFIYLLGELYQLSSLDIFVFVFIVMIGVLYFASQDVTGKG